MGGQQPGAVVVGVDGVGAALPPHGDPVLARDLPSLVAALSPDTRWVTWSAAAVAPLVTAGARLDRTWDVAEAHRLAHGGWAAGPELAWAAVRGLDPATAPAAPTGDLFDLLSDELLAEQLVRDDGHLRADAVTGAWLTTPERCAAFADAARQVAARQHEGMTARGGRALATAHAESAAAVLCVELEQHGLPIDRATARRLVTEAAGDEPHSLDEELAARSTRDAPVLAALPGTGHVDLRNPAQVKAMLARAGVDVPSTRKWVLEAHRATHPVVPALLEWRKRERIATTYGWRWLREHVGADDRLRGAWAACDGAAGRMTAQAGLHNLPAELRPAVAADEGWVFVRADLGQVEPRVLAAVSRDEAFAAATREDDLYAPVAQRLGVERSVAKIAVLAAMYGQRSGPAAEALAGLEREYPVAMAHLQRAQDRGRRGEPVRTFGGRLVRTDFSSGALDAEARDGLAAARGRFARNAVIQGSAAELFKAWAATVRVAVRPLQGRIVLCLHDELLVHVPQEHAEQAAALVDRALTDAARRWLGGEQVRFVADTSIVRRWSEAK
ncbi:DNA polymerase I [Janibacter indicus]|uniref:DNA-directed DNA polymerase n=1 Tax=Janibacter indicus TaxID=857417 RepID=A0A1L3MFD7_9MICO|nr:DNA polymerase [Janibacter indicus]APH01103.1 DNA polymerase I [Janibacter indicus]